MIESMESKKAMVSPITKSPAKKDAVPRRRLGELLVEAGLLSNEKLNEALGAQKTTGKRLGQQLVDMSAITEEEMAFALAMQLKIPYVDLKNFEIPSKVIETIPEEISRKFLCVPISLKNSVLDVAMADPLATEHKPLLVRDGEDLGAVADSVGLCKSGGTHVLAELYWADIAAALQAATGMDMSVERLKRIGERIYNLQRCYNARHGISRADDRLPRRFLEEPSPSGHARGQVIDLEPMLDEYYALRGWDQETGWPTPAWLRSCPWPTQPRPSGSHASLPDG